jgi:hypothetical protein
VPHHATVVGHVGVMVRVAVGRPCTGLRFERQELLVEPPTEPQLSTPCRATNRNTLGPITCSANHTKSEFPSQSHRFRR